MQKNALQRLPQNWQSWVTLNVAAGCEPDRMADLMVRDGPFDRVLSEYAIADAYLQHRPALFTPPPLPYIETGANTLCLPDRTVDVLLTLGIPRIVLLGNVLDDEECDALAALTSTRFARSLVVDNATGNSYQEPARTSESASLQRGETALVARIDSRLAALTHWPTDHGEPLQMQKYQAGNEYRPHFDWFDPTLPGPRKLIQQGGQRVATVILYLTDVAQGGATAFPGIGLEIHPQKGSALFFMNATPYGLPDKQTLHAGLPVETGVKIIANKWLREKPY